MTLNEDSMIGDRHDALRSLPNCAPALTAKARAEREAATAAFLRFNVARAFQRQATRAGPYTFWNIGGSRRMSCKLGIGGFKVWKLPNSILWEFS